MTDIHTGLALQRFYKSGAERMPKPNIVMPTFRRGQSYCEGCGSYKPNCGAKTCKGWRCGECRE